MPKKTKKQKMLAQLHRKLQHSSNLQFHPQSQNFELNSASVKGQNELANQNQKITYSAHSNYVKVAAVKPKSAKIDSSYAFVKNDLIRITIFTAFALAAQGMLYFLLRTR